MLEHLCGEYRVTAHFPEGSERLTSSLGCVLREWPFPGGRRMSGPRRVMAPVSLTARLKALDRLCRKIAEEINGSADLVLVHNSMYLAAPPLLRYLQPPSAYYCYEFPRHIYEPALIMRSRNRVQHLLLSGLRKRERRMDRAAALSADLMLVLSSWMAMRVRDIYGVSAETVRPGVDTERFFPDGSVSREGFVLSVGALWPFKGHETAMESISAIPAGSRPALRVVADREYPGYSKRLLSASRKLEVRLEILRGITDDELIDLYRRAGAVLCCQMNEPYGMVPLEAMACGCPVVAVDEGGFRDNIRNGENGLLVPRDPVDISRALLNVLDDRERAAALGARAREFATAERTVRTGAERLSEVLGKLLSKA